MVCTTFSRSSADDFQAALENQWVCIGGWDLCFLFCHEIVLPPVLVPRQSEYPRPAPPLPAAFRAVEEPPMPFNASYPFTRRPSHTEHSPAHSFDVAGECLRAMQHLFALQIAVIVVKCCRVKFGPFYRCRPVVIFWKPMESTFRILASDELKKSLCSSNEWQNSCNAQCWWTIVDELGCDVFI